MNRARNLANTNTVENYVFLTTFKTPLAATKIAVRPLFGILLTVTEELQPSEMFPHK